MPQSVESKSAEMRIYENSPTYPTAEELKDGLILLVQTYGTIADSPLKGLKMFARTELKELKLESQQKTEDGSSEHVINFRVSRENGEVGCSGIEISKRNSNPKDSEDPYDRIDSVEFYRDRFTGDTEVKKEPAWSSMPLPVFGNEMSIIGGDILRAWEYMLAENPKPSKQTERPL